MFTHAYMLWFLFVVLFLRMLTHVVLVDGCANSTARFDLSRGNADWIVYYFCVYGNYQIAILLFDLYSLVSKCEKRMLECITVHTILSTVHLLMIHFLWDYFKEYKFPFDESHKRPGAKLFYVECPLSILYLAYVWYSFNVNKSNCNKQTCNKPICCKKVT